MTKQWSIACHLNNIAITLDITQMNSLGKRRLHCSRARSIFAQVHFRGLTVVAVIIVLIMKEPTCRLIIMLIHRIYHFFMGFGKLPALNVIGRWIMEWAYRTNDLNIRILGFHSLANHQIAFFKLRCYQVFIANAYHFQLKRSRMSGISTHLCPFRSSSITIRPLYQIKYILNVGRHLCHRNTSLLTGNTLGIGCRILTWNTCCKHGKWLCTDVFTELKILIEA